MSATQMQDLAALAEEINRLLKVQRAAQQVIHLWQRGILRGLPRYESDVDLGLLALREALDR